jgi:UDP-GlcNAc:undecaprenyl-phosphate GlcNAc-1-phosphate transferase
VIGVSNAFNLLDVMDGVAGAAALVSLTGLLFLFGCADPAGCILLSGLGGAVFGFMVFNFPPARAYLGNAGSHFLGFFLAAMAVALSAPSKTGLGRMTAIALIFGLPLLEMVLLIVRRAGKGVWPFQKSPDHLALRLMRRGASKPFVLCLLLALGCFLAGTGLSMGYVNVLGGMGLLISAVLVSALCYLI